MAEGGHDFYVFLSVRFTMSSLIIFTVNAYSLNVL